MLNNPKVSVLIPVYNSASFVEEAINSILSQSFDDFELILLDDCSTDNSFEIISNIDDSRIRIYQNDKNMGISYSRNKLMKLALGQYLAIMDNDDISMPNRLRLQVAYLDANPQITVVGGRCELFANASEHMSYLKNKFINLGWVWCQPRNIDIYDCLKASVVMHTTAMIRKADIEKYHVQYNASLTPAEDYDLWRQILCNNLKIRNLPIVLARYNLHGENFSILNKEQVKKSDVAIKNLIKSFLNIKCKYNYPYVFTIIKKLRLKMFLRKYYD